MTTNQEMLLDDKDISIRLTGSGNIYHFSIYNDKTNKAVATQINRTKLKALADFINQYLENN